MDQVKMSNDEIQGSDPWLIMVENLEKHFPIRSGILRRQVGAIRAVDGISFEIKRGEALGLVGESGCGKTTAGRIILQLLKPTAGEVYFRGQKLSELGRDELRRLRRHMQMILQDPYASLNPRMTIGKIVGEPLEIHGFGSAAERQERIEEVLKLAGLNPTITGRYPHDFSGGMRQRIVVARALSTGPVFIIADEPLSALDASVHGQLINLFASLKAELDLTYLFMTRRLSTARAISDRLAVMLRGRIVETGSTDDVFDQPLHPYTQALRSAESKDDGASGVVQPTFSGRALPDYAPPGQACRFQSRCAYATDLCRQEDPELRDLGSAGRPHWVACHHAEQFLP